MKANAKSAIRELANNAKSRLSKGNYNNKMKKEHILEYDNKLDSKVTIKDSHTYEEHQLNERIEYFLQNNDYIPLTELIDENYFNGLNNLQKERYIIELADKVRYIKSNCKKYILN